MKKITSKRKKSDLKMEGIFEQGYGVIAKMIMLDENLTIEAKAIYSFLCSYTGAGTTCYPSISYQCSKLKISENRYLKHRRLLIENGYITITKERQVIEYEDGTSKECKDNNIYTLMVTMKNIKEAKESYLKVEKDKKKVKAKIKKEPKVVGNTDVALNLQNEGIQDEGIQNECSNNNSLNNNSLNNNSNLFILNKSNKLDFSKLDSEESNKLILVNAASNDLHEVTNETLSLVSNLTYMEVVEALEPIFIKNEEDSKKQSLKYCHNALKSIVTQKKLIRSANLDSYDS